MSKTVPQKTLGRALYSFVRYIYLYLRSVVTLSWGLIKYSYTGETPEVAHRSMIWLFCATQGKFNDWISGLISRMHPPVALPSQEGLLGNMSDNALMDQTIGQLQKKGFVVFPSALPGDVIERLRVFADSTPALVRRMDGQSTELHIGKEIFTGSNPSAVRYDYEPSDLLNQDDIQALLADGSLLSLVQDYLGCEPIADVLSMWWHTNFHNMPDAEAAQHFHFDMDRFKWVKVFVYLTDVGLDNGPHMFVEGSHASGGIPKDILERGYARIMDDEIEALYSLDKIHSFTAPKGTIIIEDTRGLHKGAHVLSDSRLILQIQFSNSLFGTSYPKSHIKEVKDQNLKNILSKNKYIYSQYIA